MTQSEIMSASFYKLRLNCVNFGGGCTQSLSALWDFAVWSERCASVPKVAGSNPSGGSESTFRSDLLLTARGSST
jgi:hypothetical protein